MTDTKKLTDDELKEVSGGTKNPADTYYAVISGILDELVGIAWSLGNWNGLWTKIYDAQTTLDRNKRRSNLKDAIILLPSYKEKLGSQYGYVLERLKYCHEETPIVEDKK